MELAELIVPVVPAFLWLWLIYRADSYHDRGAERNS